MMLSGDYYEYDPVERKLRWRDDEIYWLLPGGRDLQAALSTDSGPIYKVEPRPERKAVECVQVFFQSHIYTGALLEEERDAHKAFKYIVEYICRFGYANVIPLKFEIRYGRVLYSLEDMKKAIETNKPFPGARSMQLPFKEAVEVFIKQKYGDRLDTITQADIYREDMKLYLAMNAYKKKYGVNPYDIKSRHDIAHERFARVVREGLASASPRDRDVVMKLAKRLADKADAQPR